MIVDVHAHYYPPAYLERIDRPGLLAPGSAPLSGQSVEERLELMDRVGIDVQILSVAQAQPYLPMAGDAADAATFGNDLYIELCRQHGGRFFTFAALPMPHVQETLDEIDRIWGDPHVVGVTMGCSIADRHVDDPMFEPIFAELNRRRGTRVSCTREVSAASSTERTTTSTGWWARRSKTRSPRLRWHCRVSPTDTRTSRSSCPTSAVHCRSFSDGSAG